MGNLERRAAALPPTAVLGGTLSGHVIARTRGVPWGSSLLLVPSELRRLFGSQDQIFLAISLASLMSLPMTAPPKVARQVVEEFESEEAWPLMLDPFYLEAGTLFWNGAEDDDEPSETEDR